MSSADADSVRPRTGYIFGDFRLDPMRRLLFCREEVIPLPERPFQILLLLIQANGKTIDKNTLAARVWPDSAVSDGNIAQHVHMLRQLLGERAADRSYILTVSGRGYRFAVPVRSASSSLDNIVADDVSVWGDLLLDTSLESFRQYCIGSRYLERRSAPDLHRAIEFFNAALALEDTYVPALIGVARAYALLAEFWHVPHGLAFQRAKDAVSLALRLDQSSAVAHALHSELALFADWDWQSAEKALDRALTLNPASAFVRNNAAWFHICQGLPARAISEAQRALMIEPSSSHLLLLLARAFTHARVYDQAISCLTGLIEQEPSFYIARRYRAQAYLLADEAEKALSDLQLLPQERSEDPSFRLPMLCRAYAQLGEVQRAEAVYDALLSLEKTDFVVRWNLALAAAGIGRRDDALAYLAQALATREPTLLFLRSLPWFESLESDSGFQEILRRVGPAGTT